MDRDNNNNPLGQSPSADTDSSRTPDISPAPSANIPIISSAGLPTATPLDAPLPTDPLHPIQTTGSGEGDIWIGRRHGLNKKWLIGGIIGIVLVLIIILLVIFLPQSGTTGLGGTFSVYRNYLKYGSADEANDAAISEEEWYLFEAKSLLTEEEYSDYVGKVRDSYDAFVSELEQTEADNQEIFLQKAQLQGEELEFILLYLDLDDIENELQEAYSANAGANLANLIEQKTASDGSSEFITSARSELKTYLDQTAALLNIYQQNGCIADGYVDLSCVSGLDESGNPAFIDASAQQVISYDNLTATYDDVKSAFQISVNSFNEELGGKDV